MKKIILLLLCLQANFVFAGDYLLDSCKNEITLRDADSVDAFSKKLEKRVLKQISDAFSNMKLNVDLVDGKVLILEHLSEPTGWFLQIGYIFQTSGGLNISVSGKAKVNTYTFRTDGKWYCGLVLEGYPHLEIGFHHERFGKIHFFELSNIRDDSRISLVGIN